MAEFPDLACVEGPSGAASELIEGPVVSIVIPTKDRVRLLARGLGCAVRQRDVAVEVIVVDDGSDPPLSTSPALAALLADPRVRVVRNAASQGVAAARNRGIQDATAPWLAFLDDDDLWAPSKLAAQLTALAHAPAARWSYTGEAVLDADLQVACVNRAPPAEDIEALLLTGNAVPGGGSSVVASRDLVLELGGFDESLSIMADWDMWTRLAMRAPAAPVADPLTGYVLHPSAMSRDVPRSRTEFARIEERYRSIRSSCGAAVDLHRYLRYVADLDRRAGHRWRAAGLYVQAARAGGDRHAVVEAVAAIVWPPLVDIMERRSGATVPASAHTSVQLWVAQVIGAPEAAS
jgi:glycosyltransferase involved in cell wall biosynthesis